jgi:hypothetical protein
MADWRSELAKGALEAVLTVFAGLAVLYVWEGWFLPRRVNRRIARAIATETTQNLHLMAATLHIAGERPKSIPRDFYLPHAAFDSVSDALGDLEQPALGKVLLLYAYVRALNQIAQHGYPSTLDAYRAGKSGPNAKILEGELLTTIEAFYRQLDTALDHANELNRVLYELAEAGRIWKREPFQTKDMKEVVAKADDLVRQRAANLRRLRGQGDG